MPLIADNLARKPLSFHAVSFGNYASTLRRMAELALEVQNEAPVAAPRDSSHPTTANIPSSFTNALDSVSTRASFTEAIQKHANTM
jgi:hypothetical protein